MSHPAPLAAAEDAVRARSPLVAASPLAHDASVAASSIAAVSVPGLRGEMERESENVPSSQAEAVQETPRDASSPKHSQQSDALDGSARSIPLTVSNSQESHVTSSSVHDMTPPASDISSVTDGGAPGHGAHDASSGPNRDGARKSDHLLQLSTIAAAQDRISLGAAAGASRKRMADGEVKAGVGNMNMSPVKSRGRGHARTLSTVSVTSTGSTIGEVCA